MRQEQDKLRAGTEPTVSSELCADSEDGLMAISLRQEQDKPRAAAGDEYIMLARRSLESFVKTGRALPCPAGISGELRHQRAGVFVCLKKSGELRGCIGTISPTAICVADEIIQNAVSAGAEDPRFYPVEAAELPEIKYTVDVMLPCEPVSDISELDAQRYGVVVRCGRRTGLLLPRLEGVETVREQISIALRKAGIAPGEEYSLERFEVVRHEE